MIISPRMPVVSLDKQSAVDCPDRNRFPPPEGASGKDTKCGCLFVSIPDARIGAIKLECIWQPLWDTQSLSQGAVRFFQNPAGRDESQTNLQTAGALTWPKRYIVWELEVMLGHPYPALNDLVMRMTIGEKRHFAMPLRAMWKRASKPFAYYASLLSPLYIPAVQNFSMEVIAKRSVLEPLEIMAVMHGYLLREIP